MSSKLIDQLMRKPSSHTLTALDVVHQAALSPPIAGKCVPQLQIQVDINPSSILVLYVVDVDTEIELDAL